MVIIIQAILTFRKSFVEIKVDNVVFKRYNSNMRIILGNCTIENGVISRFGAACWSAASLYNRFLQTER